MTKGQEGKKNPLNKTKGDDTPQINRGVELLLTEIRGGNYQNQDFPSEMET